MKYQVLSADICLALDWIIFNRKFYLNFLPCRVRWLQVVESPGPHFTGCNPNFSLIQFFFPKRKHGWKPNSLVSTNYFINYEPQKWWNSDIRPLFPYHCSSLILQGHLTQLCLPELWHSPLETLMIWSLHIQLALQHGLATSSLFLQQFINTLQAESVWLFALPLFLSTFIFNKVRNIRQLCYTDSSMLLQSPRWVDLYKLGCYENRPGYFYVAPTQTKVSWSHIYWGWPRPHHKDMSYYR